MTTTSLQAPSPALTTTQLIDRATTEGLKVCWTPPSDPRQAAYARAAGTIWLRRDLTDSEVRSLLAHELGHHYHGDHGPQHPDNEARAWRWAAGLLITECAYATAEMHCSPHISALAEALSVTAEVVEAYQSILRRAS